MKRFIRLTASIMLFFALVAAAHAASDVKNTMHNMSTTANGGSFEYASTEEQICIFCHTPHGGSLTGPLWNRNDLAGNFTMYDSSTSSATVKTAAATNAVNNESMLCLSCHDGSVSVYEMINYSSAGQPNSENFPPGDVGIVNFGGGYQPNIGGGGLGTFGGDLSDDHPISFSYDAVWTEYDGASKPGLHDFASIPTAISSRLYADIGTGGHRVECSTCHNPHEATLPSFLVMSNAVSALCLGCHDK